MATFVPFPFGHVEVLEPARELPVGDRQLDQPPARLPRTPLRRVRKAG